MITYPKRQMLLACALSLFASTTILAAPHEHAAPDANMPAVDIVLNPTEMPAPIGKRAPKHLTFDLETVELVGKLADGSTYQYWTFNRKVPGPMLRVRVGDTVTMNLTNASDSMMMHNIDLHAVNGTGGGAKATEVGPGETRSFTFKAMTPGIYVYHCAIPMVAAHISSGMYGLILVEPEGGLPKVDREFYVMQGELYTTESFGAKGFQEIDYDKVLAEKPEYFVFNGAVGSLTETHPLRAKVGETIRIYFGVGGPNFTSSFHVIGTIFDKVYQNGSLISKPLEGVQTISVPPGGASVVDIKLPVPGTFMLVDHALSRVEKGLIGKLIVEGEEQPDIFRTNTRDANKE